MVQNFNIARNIGSIAKRTHSLSDLLVFEAQDGCSRCGTVFWRPLDGMCCLILSDNRRDVRPIYQDQNLKDHS